MSLRDYEVPRDNFLYDTKCRVVGGFSFPCCCCEHNMTDVRKEPCRTCDHNANAVPDNPPNPSSDDRPNGQGGKHE